MSLKEPVFIIGYPRSGTTLLQCMLSVHSHLFSFPETHFFSEVMRKLSKSAEQVLSASEIHLAFQYLNETMALKKEIFREFMSIYDKGSVAGQQIFEFIVEYFRPADDLTRTLRIIEKTPMHAMFVTQIRQLYGDAKFIHIIRDPRDAISSTMTTLPTSHSRWLPKYIRSWLQVVQRIDRYNKSMAGVIFTVCYENLIADPVSILQKICQFLEIEYEHEILLKFKDQYHRNVLTKTEYWKSEVNTGKIYKFNAKWRTRISEAQAWLIDVETHKYMKIYNYKRLNFSSISAKANVIWDSIRIGNKEGQHTFRWLKHFIKVLFYRWLFE